MSLTAEQKNTHQQPLSLAGLFIAMGIIYGDIGTSPLYVMQAIAGNRVITQELIYGAISCVFWTLTMQTTIKYVIITLQADNKGEGGIFSLYALVRKRAKWLVFPAMIGGAAFLADGVITPPISVASAVEGLKVLDPNIETVPIVVVILALLFLFQRAGTKIVGHAFGPMMFIWFSMLGVLGIKEIAHHPGILAALNPYYAAHLLIHYPNGFWLLGAVFLCTTGAEALYSDLGHCGRDNIRVSWMFVKTCLVLFYFGQGGHILTMKGTVVHTNLFYTVMPEWFVPIGICIATVAAVIASQALISGSYTLINEAMRLNLWPKVRVVYPSDLRGQIYVPSINILLWLGCTFVILWFKESANMEAAYGLSITLAMMMTTLLISVWLRVKLGNWLYVIAIGGTFMLIETMFLVANMSKFTKGGYFTISAGLLLFIIMYVWFKARKVRNRYLEFVDIKQSFPLLKQLHADTQIDAYATHLVYLTSADYPSQIERRVYDSIFSTPPKRASYYWILHVDVKDEPYRTEYHMEELIPGLMYRIDFRLGFRVAPRINLFFKKALEGMAANNEIKVPDSYSTIYKHTPIGKVKFVIIEKALSFDNELPFVEKLILDFYFLLKKISLHEGREFGLDAANVEIEKEPLIVNPVQGIVLKKV